MRRGLFALTALTALAGCNGGGPSDAGLPEPEAGVTPPDSGATPEDGGVTPPDSGATPEDGGVDAGTADAGHPCTLTLAYAHWCPSTYPEDDDWGCGWDASRPLTCGTQRAVYVRPGFGATTCCYDDSDQLVGASVRSDIADECFVSTGVGPAAQLGTGCCLGYADTSCPDAGLPD